MKKLLLLFFVLYANISFSQSFKISHISAWKYSIDRYTNEVYYGQGPNVFIRNLKDWSVRACPFPSLPAFANTSHKCVYGDGDSLFIYDFDDNSKFLVYDSVYHYVDYDYAFSPDDMYLLFYDHYFSFADSSVHYMNFDPNDDFEFDWTNETKVIYVYNEYYMSSYDYVTDILDTLFISPPNTAITTFAFNRRNNLLYYSLFKPDYPKIYSYNYLTNTDSLVFNTENDSTNQCWETYNWFQSMKWSPASSRMAFFSFELEGYNGIYAFYPDSGRLYGYTENCGIQGYDYHLKWINEDTIAFFSAYDNSIYGFALDNPVGIKETEQDELPSSIELYQNYPNPFNPSTNISYSIPKYGLVTIKVYSMLGEEVAILVNEEKPAGTYEVKFDGGSLPSGVYVYRLVAGSYFATKKLVLLK